MVEILDRPARSQTVADEGRTRWDRPSTTSRDLAAGETKTTRIYVESLAIDVEATDGEFVAIEPITGLYGEGDDEIAASMNLVRSLSALRRELSEHEGPLAPELAADLVFLERHSWI